ncbi:hypothetical protein CBR_g40851 [Chara braunii]|uniref:HECT-type E3 ubiquitin transferase n=1 Tax=Chara braunii TaxID=69332 RepID=A0A388K269_CHABU|nr:hypothetical protein CBR_g40851 [Chara braunii]|eukprot:GBG64152.1 hypothetical protein CBR_g40851 [Chara braunii]
MEGTGLACSSRAVLTQLGKRRVGGGARLDSEEPSSADDGLGLHVSAVGESRPWKVRRAVTRSLGFPSPRATLPTVSHAAEVLGDFHELSGEPVEQSGPDDNPPLSDVIAGSGFVSGQTHPRVQSQTQAQSEATEERIAIGRQEATVAAGVWSLEGAVGVLEEVRVLEGVVSPAVTAVGKSDVAGPVRTKDQQLICFFICTCQDERTLVVRASRGQTVEELYEHIRSRTGIPIAEQRLLYRGRQLNGCSTLEECGVDNDATLYLVLRLRSTTCPDVWRMVQDINDTVCCLRALDHQQLDTDTPPNIRLPSSQEISSLFQFDGGSNDDCDSLISEAKVKWLHERVTKLFRRFLANAMTHGNSTTTLGGYIEAFRVAGGATALVNLLASSSSLFQQEAACMIHCFTDENCLVFYYPECNNQIVVRRFLDCSGPLLIDICNILEAKLPEHPLNQECCSALVHWLETSTNYYHDFYVDVSAEWLADHLSPLFQKVSRSLMRSIREITALMSGASQDMEHPLQKTDAECFSTLAVTIFKLSFDCTDGRGAWLSKLELCDLFQGKVETGHGRSKESGTCGYECNTSVMVQEASRLSSQTIHPGGAGVSRSIAGPVDENVDDERVLGYRPSLNSTEEMKSTLSAKQQAEKQVLGICDKVCSCADASGKSGTKEIGHPDQSPCAQSCSSMSHRPWRANSEQLKVFQEDDAHGRGHDNGWLQEREAAWLKNLLRSVGEPGGGLGSETGEQKIHGPPLPSTHGEGRGADRTVCKMTKTIPEVVMGTSSGSAGRIRRDYAASSTGRSERRTATGTGTESKWVPCLFIQMLADLDLCLDEAEKFAHRLEVLQSVLVDHGLRGDAHGVRSAAGEMSTGIGSGTSPQQHASGESGSSIGISSGAQAAVAGIARRQTTSAAVGPSASQQSRIAHLPAAIKSTMPTILKGIHAIGSRSPLLTKFLLIVLKRNKRVLNSFMKTSHLCPGGDLWWLLEHRHLLDFAMKKEHAFSLLPCPTENQSERHLVQVSRGPQLLEEAFNQIMYTDAESLKEGLVVQFAMEEGAGIGVLREWFMLMSREIFNQENALFLACTRDRKRFFPNSLSRINPGHLAYFRFCGRDACSDQWISVSSIVGQVDSSNRQQFVDLLVNKRLVAPMLPQAQAFAKGFSDLMDNGMQLSHFLQPLELEDLDLVIYGEEKDIDIDDWKAHTTYHGHLSSSHVISLFWQVVTAMTPEERRRLLYFVTAIARLPSEGFAGLSSRFHIHRAYTDGNHLPTAHTCFQQLLLPMYQSFRVMHDRLHAVIADHAVQGFGFI